MLEIIRAAWKVKELRNKRLKDNKNSGGSNQEYVDHNGKVC